MSVILRIQLERSSAIVVRQLHHPYIYTLDPLEHHKQLTTTDPTVAIRIALHRSLPHLLVS